MRERDNRCCISGVRVVEDLFAPFRASHIHPIAHSDVWNRLNLSAYVIDDAPEKEQGESKINSVQNVLLLKSNLHDLWDLYLYGVDVNNDYRIVAFSPMNEYDGRKLFINPQTPPQYRPSPELLRNHSEQCVLANMKGAGERDDIWDPEDPHDLSQPVWQASSGGHARLELELATRLGALTV